MIDRAVRVLTLLGAAAVMTSTAVAGEGVVIEEDDFVFPLSPGNFSIGLDQFDDQNGTRQLLQVQIELEATVQAGVFIENPELFPVPEPVVQSSALFVVDVGALPITAPSVIFDENFVAEGVVLAGNDGVPGSGPDTHDFGTLTINGGTAETANEDLDAFIGDDTLFITGTGSGFFVAFPGNMDFVITNYIGFGTLRITYLYDEPTGACCIPDGSCTEVTELICYAQGGFPGPVDSTCAEADCDVIPGACCLPDATCFDVGYDDCVNQGGEFIGLLTTCSTKPCVRPVLNRMSTTEKGSFFILPKVEVRYNDFSGDLVQDTIIYLKNDWSEDVTVLLYFMNGDPPLAADPPEPAHPGYNYVDFEITLTAHQPAFWSAGSGQGTVNVAPFSLLDPSFEGPGRPADADGDPGERMVRGFIVGWAVDDEGYPVRHNHLFARADVVRNNRGQMWSYNGWHAQVVDAGIAQGDRVVTDGRIELDGVTYDAPPDDLHFPFLAAGADDIAPGTEPVARTGDCTLVALDLDLRQESGPPPTTNAEFSVRNTDGTLFTGTERCLTIWDETAFVNFGPPNNFLAETLQTDWGRASVNGRRDNFDCTDSEYRALVGVVSTTFDYGDFAYASAGASMIGTGIEPATLIYDPFGSPPPLTDPSADGVAQTGTHAGDPPAPAYASVSGPEDRVDGSSPGSVIVIPDIELRWTPGGDLVRETFVAFSSLRSGDVDVRVALIQGDPSIPNGAQGYELGHTVWFDDPDLTAFVPFVWRASAGGGGLIDFSVIDPAIDPGRIDPLTGERVLRGMLMAWATDADGAPIRWNHLTATAVTLDYFGNPGGHSGATQMNAYHFRAVDGYLDGGVIGTEDELRFDGVMYANGFDRLGVITPTVDTNLYSDAFPSANQSCDVLLSFAGLDRTWRGPRSAVTPPTTKADLRIVNENEVVFTGAFACAEGWSRRRGSLGVDGLPGVLLRNFTQSEVISIRTDGLASPQCDPASLDVALLGVLETELLAPAFVRDVSRVPMFGVGTEEAVARPGGELGDCCIGVTCWITDEASCYAGGGTSWTSPPTDNCSTCLSAAGACCLFGGCQELTFLSCLFQGGSFQGDGTTCAEVSCVDGACCFVDGGCESATELPCMLAGGSWLGAGTTCNSNQCSNGACCFLDGTCSDTFFAEGPCANAGGTWYAGASCASEDCTAGACCLSSGCVDATSAAGCVVQGGTYLGPQTLCASSNCAVGACCLPGGTCVENDLTICIAMGGDWEGGGTTCATVPPCPNYGYCCFPAGTLDSVPVCGTTSMTQCEAQGGVFRGPVDCFDTPCPQGACCLPDFTCVDLDDDATCYAAGGIAFFATEGCVNVTCASACCLLDGTCTPTPTVYQCAQLGGMWRGGMDCAAVNCSLGACCIDGACQDFVTEPDCTAMGGSFIGQVICDEFGGATVNCAVGACCLPGGACIQTDGPSCLAAGGWAIGAGTACGSGSCSAPGDIRSSRKISATASGLADLPPNSRFGSGVARLGDLDGDGVGDIAVGAYLRTDPDAAEGSVYVLFLNPNGSVKAQQRIGASDGNFTGDLDVLDAFGWSLAAIGDLDGDGRSELAVGAGWDDDGGLTNTGAVYILFLEANGTVCEHTKISTTAGGFPFTLGIEWDFGSAVTAAGDLDGDGVPDMLVGARGADSIQTFGGHVYVLLLNADGSVKDGYEIDDPAAASGGGFGSSLAYLGASPVIPGGSRFVAGVPALDTTGVDRGAVRTLDVGVVNSGGATNFVVDLAPPLAPPFIDEDQAQFGRSVGTVGDLNGDGLREILVGTPPLGAGDTGGVWLLLSDGTELGTPRLLVRPGLDDGDWFGLSARGIGDLDGDGVPEIAVGATRDDDGGENSGATYVLFMSGAANVTWTVFDLPSADDIGQEIIADIIEDALPDVIGGLPGGFPGPGGALQVFPNQGSTGGAWNGLAAGAVTPVAGTPVGLAADDLDADEDNDVAVVDGSAPKLLLFENTGAGGLVLGQSLTLPGLAPDVTTGDPDGDGDRNVLVPITTLDAVQSYGPAGGSEFAGGITFALDETYAAPDAPTALVVADLDGDGDEDLVIAGRGAEGNAGDDEVRLVRFEGGFVAATAFAPVGLDPVDVAVGDVSGDGHLDVVTLNADDTVTVLLGDGAGGLTRVLDAPAGSDSATLVVADLDGDGDADVVTTAVDPELGRVVSILESEAENALPGTVILGAPDEVETPGEPAAVAAGDLDGDGMIDLAVGGGAAAQGGGGSLVVLLGDVPNPCPADLDGNGDVGFEDLLAVLSAWGVCPPVCPQDIDGSGDVGFGDLLAVLSAWGPCS